MASNKYDTPFEAPVINTMRIHYSGLYGTNIEFEGTVEQCVRHLNNLSFKTK